MRIAVTGSGRPGGSFGARLCKGGADIHFIARGKHLQAMRSEGLRVDSRLRSVVACMLLATSVSACTVVRELPKTGLPAENPIHVLKRDLFYGQMFFHDREPEIFPPWSEPAYPRATRFGEWDNQARQTIDLLPSSIAEFRSNPGKWPRIIGIVPASTHFKLVRVNFEQEFEYHAYYFYGEFIDGPYAGRTVLLNDIWQRASEYVDSKESH